MYSKDSKRSTRNKKIVDNEIQRKLMKPSVSTEMVG